MSYEPELGQMFFGNHYEGESTPRYIRDGIDRIDELISTHIYKVKRTFSYGEWSIDYSYLATSNTGMIHDLPGAPFTMRSYYWGYCDCGFDEVMRRLNELADKQLGYLEETWESAWDTPETYKAMRDQTQEVITGLLGAETLREHKKTCTPEVPNFSFPGAGFKAFWYKHSHRGETCTNPPSKVEWQKIEAECIEWILAQSPKSPN